MDNIFAEDEEASFSVVSPAIGNTAFYI